MTPPEGAKLVEVNVYVLPDWAIVKSAVNGGGAADAVAGSRAATIRRQRMGRIRIAPPTLSDRRRAAIKGDPDPRPRKFASRWNEPRVNGRIPPVVARQGHGVGGDD